ncbi:MAG: hypothetical protein JOY75_25380 [Hyphomicrobiales bacterium]|nr:hypothetical protein [Hyphomicrobiales bacterium]
MTGISSSSVAHVVSLFAYLATGCVSLRQFKSAKDRPSGVGSVKKHWDGSANLDLAFSAFFLLRESPMLTLRPIDTVAIEKQLESADAPVISVSVSTIDAADLDGLPPRGRLQQEEVSAPLHRQKGPKDVPLDAPSIQSDVRVRSFALAFVGMVCATAIGFVSEIRPLKPDSADYGYDEALGTETSSLSSANFVSNCPGDRQPTAEASKDGLGRLGVSAIAAHAAESPTASFKRRQ